MIKISKDNLFLWGRIFPGMICLLHLPIGVVFTYIAFESGLYFLFLIYSAIFCGHFFWIKVHKFFLAKDVYYLPSTKQIKVVNNDNEVVYDIAQIEAVVSKRGFAKVKINVNHTLYFFQTLKRTYKFYNQALTDNKWKKKRN